VSNRVPEPFYVYDIKEKGLSLASLGITLFSSLGFFQGGFWGSPYPPNNIINFLAILSFVISVVLFFHSYFNTRRVEFYGGFARLFSRDKKVVIDVKYSGLYFKWKPRRIRRARYILTQRYSHESIDRQQSWQVYEVKGTAGTGGMSLFQWLKTGKLNFIE